MKNFKVYLKVNDIQICGINIKANEVIKDSDTAIYADKVYIDFDMEIDKIVE